MQPSVGRSGLGLVISVDFQAVDQEVNEFESENGSDFGDEWQGG